MTWLCLNLGSKLRTSHPISMVFQHGATVLFGVSIVKSGVPGRPETHQGDLEMSDMPSVLDFVPKASVFW